MPDLESNSPPGDLTLLLEHASRGNHDAMNQLFPIVYGELRARAGAYFLGQPPDMTIQPTALVHEVFAKLIRSSSKDWNGRDHFFAIASSAMRQILIDHARRRDKERRAVDGYVDRSTIVSDQPDTPSIDLLALEEVIVKLESLDATRARIVELRFFGGLENGQVASVLGVSESTIGRQWRHIRAWMAKEISE